MPSRLPNSFEYEEGAEVIRGKADEQLHLAVQIERVWRELRHAVGMKTPEELEEALQEVSPEAAHWIRKWRKSYEEEENAE